MLPVRHGQVALTAGERHGCGVVVWVMRRWDGVGKRGGGEGACQHGAPSWHVGLGGAYLPSTWSPKLEESEPETMIEVPGITTVCGSVARGPGQAGLLWIFVALPGVAVPSPELPVLNLLCPVDAAFNWTVA